MKLLLLAVMAVAISKPIQGKQSAGPVAPGLYCQIEPVTGDTGTGQGIPLGDFIMSAEVRPSGGGYAVTITNQMPDNPQILQVQTSDASVLEDGSLVFEFTDGWGNEGRARVHPNATVVLVMTKRAKVPGNQIGRNYGTFNLFQSECAGDRFRQFR